MDPPVRSSRTSAYDILTVLLLAASVAIFWTSRIGQSQPPRPPASEVHAGDVLPFIAISDTAGATADLLGVHDQERTLVFAFKSDCPACAAQKADWLALAHKADSAGWRVIAITPEPFEEHVRNYFGDAPVRVVHIDGTAASAALDIRVVPSTILAGPSRTVLFYGNGRMSQASLDSVQRLLRAGGTQR